MKKNILVIDDSALIRRVLSDIINSDDRFQVCGTATNGIEALDIVIRDYKSIDALMLDINMPKMGGLEFLEQLSAHKIKIPILVVSTLAKEGAKETIRALELGAFDFITKPDSFAEAKGNSFHNKILTSLGVMFGDEQSIIGEKKTTAKPAPKPARTFTPSPMGRVVSNGKKLIALACSTGGPRALQSVIPTLPSNLDAPMLIVQHMPEGFTKSLAVRLNELSNVYVKEAEDGDVIEKGTVYIAKGGRQMRLKKGPDGAYRLTVTQEPARNALKPCADIMYESLVSSDFEEITCVVLTGMGGDGTNGISQLKQTNKIYVIAQDEATSTVYGMPKIVAEAGLTDEVVPLNQVSGAITKNVGVR
ncbi:MAG: chemotaxis-specific protein-glutamate methyltransferase CheB [Lachnospiraceae bacterium]|nr:chemotaxis-specific protein-glutamate methyltransferase CheB [Lachnospiraceae bacterium]